MAITKVHLLSIHLENDYKHTLFFESKSAQSTYFQGKIEHSFTDFTYQRKDNKIRIGVEYDTIFNCNYVMYQNTAYSNKWFYCFITDMKYISEGVTEIYIETDVIQTYMFDIEIKKSFIEREHTNDDSIGANTVPEGLEIGDYICNVHAKDTTLDDLVIVVGSTESSTGNRYEGGQYGGIYSGVKYHFSEGYTVMNQHLLAYDWGKIEAIVNVFMAPKFLCDTDQTFPVSAVNYSSEAKSYNITQAKHYYLEGYEPKNNKLFCYPYSYLLVSNNNGSSAIYKYELFENTNMVFKVQGVLTPGCSIRMVPLNYAGISVNDEEGINLGKYPICNWNSDAYTNWMTQNSVNTGVSIATTLLGAMAGGTTGLIVAGGSALNLITNSIGESAKMSLTPAHASGNTNCGDVITASKKNSFHFYKMSIKSEYAKILDDYFTMFGYKTNRVKVPNKNHRKRFWYTKTVDCEIDGKIPQKDLEKIKNCYNNGITFWRNASEIGEFNLDNPIV